MTTGEISPVSNPEILVVEDDISSLKMLSDLLTGAGYRVRPASDGELGLRSVQLKQPDLILLDFRLPGINGLEVCRHLKDNPRTCDIPVIFISALGDSELKVKALEAGAIDYVTKPIDSTEVLARINTHLNLYRMQRELEAQAEELEKHRKHLEVLVQERTAELRDSEQRAHALLNATTELALLMNPEGVVVAANQAAAERYGLTPEELVGRSAFDFVGPEVAERRRKILQGVVEGRKPVRGEDENQGTLFDNSVYPLLDDEGNVRLVAVFAADITERKRAEEALRLSEQSLAMAQQVALIGSWDWDIEKDTLTWSDETFRQFGLKPGEIVPSYEVFEKFIHPSDVDRVNTAVRESSEKAAPYSIDARMLRVDGSEWTMHAQGIAYRNDEGRLVRFVGTQQDISESRRAEEERERAWKFMQTVIDGFPEALTVVNRDYTIALANRTVREMSGVRDPVAACLKCYQVTHGRETPCDCNEHPCPLQQVRETKEPVAVEHVRHDAQGRQIVVDLIAAPIFGEDGEVVQIIESARDITERKRAEEKIAASLKEKEVLLREIHHRELMYTNIIQTSRDGFCVIDASNAGFIEVNESLCEMLGYSREELLGMHLSDVEAAESAEEVESHVRKIIEIGFEQFETRHRRKDGVIIAVEVSSQFLSDEERFVCFLRNITERKRAEEKIAASLKEKEVLLREIHHRVKNNMQIIVSMLRMHARQSASERMRNVFDDCRNRVNAMSLIHEALYQSEDLARIDSGSYFKKLFRNLSQAHGAAGRGIGLSVGKQDVLLGMDQAVAVGMIVCELLSNIFKHAFPGGGPGAVSVSLSNLGKEEVELIVQDDGVGLPPEIDILNSPSLGLRLAAITTTHELGGSIKVERDGGTRFVIRFKRKDI